MDEIQEIKLIRKYPRQCEKLWIEITLIEYKNGHPITNEEFEKFLNDIPQQIKSKFHPL